MANRMHGYWKCSTHIRTPRNLRRQRTVKNTMLQEDNSRKALDYFCSVSTSGWGPAWTSTWNWNMTQNNMTFLWTFNVLLHSTYSKSNVNVGIRAQLWLQSTHIYKEAACLQLGQRCGQHGTPLWSPLGWTMSVHFIRTSTPARTIIWRWNILCITEEADVCSLAWSTALLWAARPIEDVRGVNKVSLWPKLKMTSRIKTHK